MIVSLTPEQMALYAARYQALRLQVKNKEVSIEIWARPADASAFIGDEDELDDHIDEIIRRTA